MKFDSSQFDTAEPTPVHGAGDVVAEFPLTATQTRCWFLDQMQPGNPALNIAVRWEVRGDLRSDHLDGAFRAVIARHEILRTRFVNTPGGPVQQVLEDVPFNLATVDLRTIPEADQAGRVDAIAHEVAARPFDLGQAGLIRATLARLSADRAILVIVVHQTCFDGYSIRVLGHEIGEAAAASQAERQPDLPDLPLQYGDFALWQQEFLASDALRADADYWTDRLTGAPYFEVEPDHPSEAVRSTDAAQISRDLPQDFGTRLDGMARSAGVSRFSVGAAVFAACLHRMTGAQDILFGTQVAGRTDVDLEALIGVFINNVVLRFPAMPDARFTDHLRQSGQVVEQALAHQDMPFNLLVERLNPARDAARTPVISINFNLQSVFMETRDHGPFSLRSAPSHAPGTIYDLDLAVMSRPGGWQLSLEYATRLFDAATAEAILDLVQAGFDAVFAAPDAPLSGLPLPAGLAQRGQADRLRIAAVTRILKAHPLVGDVAVIRQGTGLFGFVTPGDTGAVPLEELPERVLASLPSDATTEGLTGLSLLAAIPRGPDGTVDAARLKVPARRGQARAEPARLAELSAALAEDWCEILGLDAVPPGRSFFDLGGHSVLVLRLLTRIQDRWNQRLDVAQVYQNATLPELASLIAARLEHADAAPAEDWRILRLGGPARPDPLIAVNNAATALALAGQDTATGPVACVRIYDSERGTALTPRPFEEIARDYARVIREAQPEGPYLLYGNCSHGNIALEAARHLQAEGATITGVVMKDVWEPGYTARLLADPRMKRREKVNAIRNRLRAVRDGEMSVAALLGSFRMLRRLGVPQAARMLRLIPDVRMTDLEAGQEAIIRHLSQARDNYRPLPVNFPVLHVVTDITPRGPGFSPSIGWEDVVAPGLLTTRTIDKVLVLREKRIGIPELSHEIAAFVGSQGDE